MTAQDLVIYLTEEIGLPHDDIQELESKFSEMAVALWK